MKTGLKAENQSKITKLIQAMAENITGDNLTVIQGVIQMVINLKIVHTDKPDFSRTAEEILTSGEQRGCHEAGVAMVTLLRAKGIEAKYVQTFFRETLEQYGENGQYNRKGHIFIRVELPEGEKIINSTTGEITTNIPEEYVVGAEGQNAWEIGVKSPEDYDNLLQKTKLNLNAKQ